MPLEYEANFDDFIKKNHEPLLSIARKRADTKMPAEAVLNEFYLAGWGKFEFRCAEDLEKWCKKGLLFAALRLIREREGGRRKDGKPRDVGHLLRPVNLPDNWESETSNSDPAMAAESAESASKLKQAIAKLPHDQRIVLQGKILDGLAMTELARRLNRKVSEIKTLFERAIESLRRDLGSLGDA